MGGRQLSLQVPLGTPFFPHLRGHLLTGEQRWSAEGRGKETQILQADSPRCMTWARHQAALVENCSLQ